MIGTAEKSSFPTAEDLKKRREELEQYKDELYRAKRQRDDLEDEIEGLEDEIAKLENEVNTGIDPSLYPPKITLYHTDDPTVFKDCFGIDYTETTERVICTICLAEVNCLEHGYAPLRGYKTVTNVDSHKTLICQRHIEVSSLHWMTWKGQQK